MVIRHPKNAPYLPPPYDAADAFALKALQAGTANEAQQQRALRWIIETAAATYDLPYRPNQDGGDRDTAFAAGKMFVGQQIVKLLNIKPELLRSANHDDPSSVDGGKPKSRRKS